MKAPDPRPVRHGLSWLAVAALLITASAASAQTTTLSITPLTWNVVGLDKNDPPPLDAGPNIFLSGARVCNTGAVAATVVTATFVWDSVNTYINLQNGSGVLTEPTVAAGDCFDFYFNIEITRDDDAIDTNRDFHITATALNALPVSTPTPREIYVEGLNSQNRNSNISIGGPTTVWPGGTFKFTMDAETGSGFGQISVHTIFSNAIFQVIEAVTTFDEGDVPTVDSIYADACGWVNDPTDNDYKECTVNQDAGGTVHQDYWVKILAFPDCGGGCTQQQVTLDGVIYDFSGNAYNYNANYGSVQYTFTLLETPTAALFHEAKAARIGSRVAIEWETDHEVRNLGYHVWREVHGQKTRITPSLIAGSSLRAGSDVPLAAGHDYAWFDDVPDGTYASYWIEEVGLDGSSTIHGPIEVEQLNREDVERGPRGRFSDMSARSPFLHDLARLRPRSGERFEVIGAEVEPAEEDLAGSYEFGIAADSFEVTTDATASPSTTQFTIASRTAVKLTIRTNDWHRVDGAALAAAGLALPVESRKLHLYADGRAVPMQVDDGGDRRFDASDSISFYGTALDTVSTDGHIYWLFTDTKSAARIKPGGTSGSAASLGATSFPFSVQRQDRVLFFSALQNGDDDSFFGPVVMYAPYGATQQLQVRNIDSGGASAVLEVVLQGVTEAEGPDPDHRVQVELNGLFVGEMQFDGRDSATATFSVSPSLLHDGSNTILLTALNGATDYSLVDRVRLTYPHTYEADDDSLRFSAPGRTKVIVDGFSSSDITVIDVTNPSAPVTLAVTATQTSSGWSATVKTPTGTSRALIASTRGAMRAPASAVPNQPSSWNRTSNMADFVIIGHGSFLGQAGPLATQRTADGYRVATIDVEDVYDEFSYGAKDPAAIRSFLSYARSKWRVKPTHVLLFGDGSVDPRNYLGFGGDYLPVHLVTTEFSKAPWDDWFTDFNNDSIADIALGRLPARNSTEAATMVSKTLAYGSAAHSAWMDRVEIVSDANDIAGENDFRMAADALATQFPSGLQIEKTYVDTLGITAARSKLLTRWNAGTGFISYHGHGAPGSWSPKNLFTPARARTLTNGSQLPVVSTMTCLTAFFHDPYTESIGEALLRNTTGGAVAVWGSSGLTFLAPQLPMGEQFVRSFVGSDLTIGEAAMAAKQATTDIDIRRTWILFADPTLKYRQ